jgi:glutathione S-transferase
MTGPILYSFRRCPYAMRARLALLVSQTDFELREISLKNKPADMIALSPKATVPVLHLPDGTVIDESLDIMTWALARHDPENWLGSVNSDLIIEFDGPFKHHLDRYKYPDRHGSNCVAHRIAGYAMLEKLDHWLSETAFISCERCSFTDIALMPFVRQYARIDAHWFAAQPLPGLHRWLQSLTTSMLFAQAMEKYPVWGAENGKWASDEV